MGFDEVDEPERECLQLRGHRRGFGFHTAMVIEGRERLCIHPLDQMIHIIEQLVQRSDRIADSPGDFPTRKRLNAIFPDDLTGGIKSHTGQILAGMV